MYQHQKHIPPRIKASRHPHIRQTHKARTTCVKKHRVYRLASLGQRSDNRTISTDHKHHTPGPGRLFHYYAGTTPMGTINSSEVFPGSGDRNEDPRAKYLGADRMMLKARDKGQKMVLPLAPTVPLLYIPLDSLVGWTMQEYLSDRPRTLNPRLFSQSCTGCFTGLRTLVRTRQIFTHGTFGNRKSMKRTT